MLNFPPEKPRTPTPEGWTVYCDTCAKNNNWNLVRRRGGRCDLCGHTGSVSEELTSRLRKPPEPLSITEMVLAGIPGAYAAFSQPQISNSPMDTAHQTSDTLDSTAAGKSTPAAPAPTSGSTSPTGPADTPAPGAAGERPAVWYGFDLDRTLASYTHWLGVEHIGEPLAPMVDKVRQYLAAGKRVKIFTARVWSDYTEALDSIPKVSLIGIKTLLAEARRSNHKPERVRWLEAELALRVIRRWCVVQFGQELEVTCVKDPWCLEIWDDIARQVTPNEGTDVNQGLINLWQNTSKRLEKAENWIEQLEGKADDKGMRCWTVVSVDQEDEETHIHHVDAPTVEAVLDSYAVREDEVQVIAIIGGRHNVAAKFDLNGN